MDGVIVEPAELRCVQIQAALASKVSLADFHNAVPIARGLCGGTPTRRLLLRRLRRRAMSKRTKRPGAARSRCGGEMARNVTLPALESYDLGTHGSRD
jgi:hypothetical protein